MTLDGVITLAWIAGALLASALAVFGLVEAVVLIVEALA
jgi:hypothetical protein